MRWTLSLALLAACGSSGDGSEQRDAGVELDAALGCTDTTSATIGRCATQTLDACSGVDDENQFASLAAGATSPLIVGFQGATMMPLAVRASSIVADGGANPSDHPRVVASLTDENGVTVATYQNAVPFSPVAGQPDEFEMLDIYLVFSGDATPYVDQPLDIAVRVTDRDNEVRCSELRVIAGAF